MSDGEVLVSGGEASDNGEFILRRLPPWMPRDPSTGNFKLLDTVGRAIDRLDDDITDLDAATAVQHAESVAQLEELARLVELPPQQNEGREKYRTRLIAEFQTMTTEGTPADVIENTATLLDIDSEKITYSKLDENGAVSLDIPGDALDSLGLSDSEFIDIIGKHAAAGFRIEATISGTFTYLDETKDPSTDSNPDYGYDGLDADGNPKGNGGTYAGLID